MRSRGPVLRLIARRLCAGGVVLFVVSLLIFASVSLLPGDLAEIILGQSATPETVRVFRQELGLDLPAHARYYNWIANMLAGDMGTSLANGREVAVLIGPRFYNTMFLAAVAATVAVPISLFFGITTAIYRDRPYDRAVNITALVMVSLPEFFVAYILIYLLSVRLHLFPSIATISPETTFAEQLYKCFLPAMSLVLVVIAHLMRMTRASILNVLANDYIQMAILKGLRTRRVILRHAMPNALAPIINVMALNLAYLIVGVVVVEVVFAYPGLGQLLVDSVSKRDIPVVQACSLIFAFIYVSLNIVADVLSIMSNPKLLGNR